MAVELITALVYMSIVLRFDITISALEMLVLASILICITLTDLEDYTIPNSLIIAGIVLKIVFLLFSGNFFGGLGDALVGGLSVALPLLLVVLLADKVMKKDTMGGGDIKLFFMVGMYFSWQLNILVLILACGLGIIFSFISMRGKLEGGKLIPWGPSIAVAAWLAMLVGDTMIMWYLGFF